MKPPDGNSHQGQSKNQEHLLSCLMSAEPLGMHLFESW